MVDTRVNTIATASRKWTIDPGCAPLVVNTIATAPRKRTVDAHGAPRTLGDGVRWRAMIVALD
jgi:hypothetical protein